jgi:quinol monooxygenase YgiN
MDSKQHTILARIKAKPGMHDEVRNELLALIAPTRKESGCISYDLHQVAEGDFIFYENWRSKEDLDQHVLTDHFQSFFGKTDRLLAEEIEVTEMVMIVEQDTPRTRK